MNKYIKLSFVVAFIVVSGLIYSCNTPVPGGVGETTKESIVIETMTQTATEAAGAIYVYICGEVVNPGVYEMEAGSRLYELIETAGGFTDKAAKDSLNLAEELIDSQMITVWSMDDMLTATVTGPVYDDGLVNINTAGINELTSLPGIGEVRARDIISYREENESFTVTEDIMKVPGIKESVYEKIKDLITVG